MDKCCQKYTSPTNPIGSHQHGHPSPAAGAFCSQFLLNDPKGWLASRQTIPQVPVVFVPAIVGPFFGSVLSLFDSHIRFFSRIFAMAFWLKFDDNRYQTQCASQWYFSGRLILSLMIFGMIRCWSFLSHGAILMPPKTSMSKMCFRFYT